MRRQLDAQLLKAAEEKVAQERTEEEKRAFAEQRAKQEAAGRRRHKETQSAARLLGGDILVDEDLVFSQLDGAPYKPDAVSHAFLECARQAGIEGATSDSLRHMHASLMLGDGVHPKVVS